jgi:hypothetical protein
MKAYNLADLERELNDEGWVVVGESRITPQATPGQVHIGSYDVVLTSPDGETFSGNGPTRADALRLAAHAAGLIAPDQPHLQ